MGEAAPGRPLRYTATTSTRHSAVRATAVAMAAPSSPREGKPSRPKISRALPPTLSRMESRLARVGRLTSPVQRHTMDRIMLTAVTG